MKFESRDNAIALLRLLVLSSSDKIFLHIVAKCISVLVVSVLVAVLMPMLPFEFNATIYGFNTFDNGKDNNLRFNLPSIKKSEISTTNLY